MRKLSLLMQILAESLQDALEVLGRLNRECGGHGKPRALRLVQRTEEEEREEKEDNKVDRQYLEGLRQQVC